jgi:hypothetical protein
MKIFNILNFVFAITLVECFFKKENVCQNDQFRCIGIYDKTYEYSKVCDKICTGKFSYKCSKNYCTVDKQQCLQIAYKFKQMSRSQLLTHDINAFKRSISSFDTCTPMKYNLTNDDICLNGQGCISKTMFSIRNERKNLVKSIVCPCISKKYNYHCGNNFCAIHSSACDSLMSNETLKLTKFKKCNNDNIVLNKRFKYFN